MSWTSVLVLDIPFDPSEFIGKKFFVVEQDPRSEDLKMIDLNTVIFFGSCLSGEMHITGEEKRKRLIAMGCVPFSARVFIALYREKNQESLEWIYKKNNRITRLDFLGTVLRDRKGKKGRRFALYLRRCDDDKLSIMGRFIRALQWVINLPSRIFGRKNKFLEDKWVWGFRALDIEWDSECYSGSVAPSPDISHPPISRVHPKGLSGRIARPYKPKGLFRI
jgi:hypothetical protein